MGIHRLLHSSCCFLNTSTAIMRQLIRTARTLEAEWWQVCGEVWVWGKRKMSQILVAFGLLDFTMLRPVLTWHAFWNLWTVYFFNFTNFFQAVVNRGLLKPRVLNLQMWGSACIYKMHLSNTLALLQPVVLRNAGVCEIYFKYLNDFCLLSESKHLVGCSDKTKCECCNGVWISSKNYWCYAVIFREDFGGEY